MRFLLPQGNQGGAVVGLANPLAQFRAFGRIVPDDLVKILPQPALQGQKPAHYRQHRLDEGPSRKRYVWDSDALGDGNSGHRHMLQ